MALFAERPDGRIADAIKRVPAEPLPPEPPVPTLLEKITAELQDGTGHDTELDHRLG